MSISVNSISFAWYSAPFRAQPITSLILFLQTCGPPPYSPQYYIKGGWTWSISSVPHTPVCMAGKDWARDIRRTWLYCSQELERIISGKENKEGVEFLCWVCIRVKRTQMHMKCIHWYKNITAHERALHDVHWTVFSFLNTWSKVLLKVGFLLE